jgi:ferredoxin
MTPQEKAKELFDKYFSEIRMPSDCEGCMQCVDKCGNVVAIAKKYALIAADAVIEQNNIWIKQTGRGTNNYWKDVKQEIEKL